MKVINTTKYDSIQNHTITVKGKTYKLSYNKIELIEKDDGSKLYNLSLFYKERKGVRVIKHIYTDMKKSFKVQLVLLQDGKSKVINDLQNIGSFMKTYLA